MQRKRWTAKAEVTEDLLQFRQKRKWQIALRRYILDGHKSSFYAPYFGLGIEQLRRWIEIQFDETINWDNFSAAWQFDHIVPLAYFDFDKEEDLKLCWNFTNLRVDKIVDGKNSSRSSIFAAKPFFETLYSQTGYAVCKRMVEKIKSLEEKQELRSQELVVYLKEHQEYLSALQSFSAADYEKINTGAAWKDVAFEKAFLKKFGG